MTVAATSRSAWRSASGPRPRSTQRVARAARAGAPRAVRRPATRRSCPVASGSGWRWPARSRSSRRCCCSTSRSARSTPRSARSCATWLRRLHDEVHVTTVFVTHDQEEAMEVADSIVVMADGKVEQVGTPDELYDEPANDFVMSFLGPVTTARRAAGAPARPGGQRRSRVPGSVAGHRSSGWSGSASRCASTPSRGASPSGPSSPARGPGGCTWSPATPSTSGGHPRPRSPSPEPPGRRAASPVPAGS